MILFSLFSLISVFEHHCRAPPYFIHTYMLMATKGKFNINAELQRVFM